MRHDASWTVEKEIFNFPNKNLKELFNLYQGEDLGEEHLKTGFPIIYTSADSVFQIAVDTDLIPLSTLYEWCQIARKMFDDIGVTVSYITSALGIAFRIALAVPCPSPVKASDPNSVTL